MTYEESFALMNNQIFRGRIQVSVLRYADSIMIEATSVVAHNTRVRWAQDAMRSPQQMAVNVQPNVVMDGKVQEAAIDPDGDSAIIDSELQISVETVVNKMM